jgi:hypothetical protein
MNQEKNDGDNKPDHRQGVEQAMEEVAEHQWSVIDWSY